MTKFLSRWLIASLLAVLAFASIAPSSASAWYVDSTCVGSTWSVHIPNEWWMDNETAVVTFNDGTAVNAHKDDTVAAPAAASTASIEFLTTSPRVFRSAERPAGCTETTTTTPTSTTGPPTTVSVPSTVSVTSTLPVTVPVTSVPPVTTSVTTTSLVATALPPINEPAAIPTTTVPPTAPPTTATPFLPATGGDRDRIIVLALILVVIGTIMWLGSVGSKGPRPKF